MTIRLLFLTVLLGLFLPVVPVFGAVPGPYLELQGMTTLLRDSENDTDAGRFNLTHDPGYGYALAVGYDLAEAYPQIGTGRLELEAAYRSVPLDQAELLEGTLSADGDVTVMSLLLNTIAEYHNQSRWVPYIGVGGGYAKVAIESAEVAGAPFLDTEDQVFAYQALAGVGLEVSDHATVNLGYRFFGTLNPDFEMPDGSGFESELASHNFVLGLRLRY